MRRKASTSHFCLTDKAFCIFDGFTLGVCYKVSCSVAELFEMIIVGGCEYFVVSCPCGEPQWRAPCALQFEAHLRHGAVGLCPVAGELCHHFLAVVFVVGQEGAAGGRG